MWKTGNNSEYMQEIYRENFLEHFKVTLGNLLAGAEQDLATHTKWKELALIACKMDDAPPDLYVDRRIESATGTVQGYRQVLDAFEGWIEDYDAITLEKARLAESLLGRVRWAVSDTMVHEAADGSAREDLIPRLSGLRRAYYHVQLHLTSPSLKWEHHAYFT